LVAHGVRAQLQTGNLLTGSAFVAFDFFHGVPPAAVDWAQNPPQLPTTPGQLEAVEAGLGNIVAKLNKMPLQQIGENLQKSLADLDLTLVSARGTLDGARATLNTANGLVGPRSEQIQDVDQTLQELSRAARSVRILTDYLEQHPEALIRGKKGEAK
jgi:paraquat-inducible protein B